MMFAFDKYLEGFLVNKVAEFNAFDLYFCEDYIPLPM